MWFPSLFMVPGVVWLQCVFHLKYQHFRWIPSLFMVSSVDWFQCVFHLKSIFWVVLFPLHGSLCCLVPSVIWLQHVFHSKSTFWVVPFTCFGSQCCLAPKCFLLKMNILFGSLLFLWFPVLFGSNMFSTLNQHF